MAEIHLDLCIQSTNHLLETVSNIKENLRILEVFLNSGLRTTDFNKPIGFLHDGYSSSEGRGSVGVDGKIYHHQFHDASNGRMHSNCCCMCRFRESETSRDRIETFPEVLGTASESRTSTTSDSPKKTVSAPPTPRLNKTASLRRAKILQKVSRKNSLL